jgi:hypothetical protein
VPAGFYTGYDDNLDSEYDYNEGVEHYRPGVLGYNPKFVKDGLKAIHTLADSVILPSFLVSYENPINKGEVYDITLWIATDDESIKNTKITLSFVDHPQFDAPVVKSETLDITGLEKGKWTKFTFTVDAYAPYMVITTKGGESLYFDAVQVVPLDKEAELDMPIDTEIESEPKSTWMIGLVIAFACACGLIFIAVIIIITALIIKKKRRAVK